MDIESRLVLATREGTGGRVEWEVKISRCRLLHIGCINKDPTVYSTGIYVKWTPQVVLVVKNPPANEET